MFPYEILRFVWWVLSGVLLMGSAATEGLDKGVGMRAGYLGKTDTVC